MGIAFTSHARDRGSVSIRDRPKSLKEKVVSPVPDRMKFKIRYFKILLDRHKNRCTASL